MKMYRLTALAVLCSAPILAAAQAGPVKIGVVTPLSGTYAGIGQQVRWGLDLAAAEINAAGGIDGRKLELLYEDEEANPAVATQKAESSSRSTRWTSSRAPSTPARRSRWARSRSATTN
jgi:outer membrane PBP1 activator LpoA protein